MSAATPTGPAPSRHRPKSFTVFAAAFLAGAAAAVGVNRVLDVQLAQRKPQVECEPIFVALRSMPQGAPVTVWDVALKDWPKAMLPASALRASDSFEGFVLRHALREGQPLLAVQLVRGEPADAFQQPRSADESFVAPVPAAAASTAQADLWTPAEPIGRATLPPPATTATAAPVEPKTPAASVETVTPAPPERQAETARAADATPTVESASQAPASESVASTAAVPTTPATPVSEAVPEPTVAGPTPGEEPQRAELPHGEPTVAASASDIEPLVREPLLRQRPTVAEPDDDLTDAVPPDVASIPSVMASSDKPAAAPTRASGKQSNRYLVVPERVAIQADTSFTTPRPQPPGPPPVAGAVGTAVAQQNQPQRPQAGAGQRQQQPAVTVGRNPARRDQQGRAQQPQPQQSRGRQPAAPQQPQQQRTWGGLFPNVAAGIDSVSGPWQKARSGSTQQPAGGQPPARR